jgi:hypothetical protein
VQKNILLKAFELMSTAKAMAEKFEANKEITSKYVHATSRGHEAIQLAVGMQLKPQDWVAPYYRDDSILLGIGMKPYELMLQVFSKKDDPFSGGRTYYCHPSLNREDMPKIPHQSSATGMQAIPTTGLAMGIQYKEKTGQDLEITDEEFYDLMRKELSMEARELGLLFSMMIVVIAAKMAIPPEDEDPITSNKYKFYIKVLSKAKDELSFYYNPLSFESVTKGSIIPSLGILVKAEKAIVDLERETRGTLTGDEELMDKAHPTKRVLDLIPGPSQFQQEILPLISPDLAKEMGIRVTAEARRQ